MGREIQLDGSEITVLKAIGIGGSGVDGETLISRCVGMEIIELIDTLRGMIDLGYVDADRDHFYNKDEMAELDFRVNSGWAKDLDEAMDPTPDGKKSKRVRRE